MKGMPYYPSTPPPPTLPPSPRVETFHHIVAYVTREPGDVLVSATRLDEHTDLATVEHLDFEPTCENRFCEDGRPTAVVFVEEVPCWSCGDVQPEPFEFECKRCIDRYLRVGSCCGECSTSLDFDETLRIIRWLS